MLWFFTGSSGNGQGKLTGHSVWEQEEGRPGKLTGYSVWEQEESREPEWGAESP